MGTKMEENLKKFGITDIKKDVHAPCHCGGNIVTFWGKLASEPKKVGPVCEKCGALYSAFAFSF